MHIPSLIEKKRDGGELTADEIAHIISMFTSGALPDHQMGALAMAVVFRGMKPAETAALTLGVMNSGRVLKYPPGSPPRVDRHSTGGVGDKVSLVLAPLLACDEVWVPMIASRGLGINGGTLDKLESIPGFNVNLDEAAALAQLQRIGVFMIGQTADICPADKKLHALREVTGTLPSEPLIVASIMSRKLAESLDRLVLDVKFGSGAFMKTRPEAQHLANALAAVGEPLGVKTSHLISPMHEPLGRTVGTALEAAEAIATLRGGGPDDLKTLTLDLAERVASAPRAKLEQWLADGTAWAKFVALVEAQGGDATALEHLAQIHGAPVVRPLCAPAAGTLVHLDAGLIGQACVQLGAGRTKAGDAVDFTVGVSELLKTGTRVEKGQPLMQIHARSESSLEAAWPLFLEAVQIR